MFYGRNEVNCQEMRIREEGKIRHEEGRSKLSLPLYFTSFLSPSHYYHPPFHRSVNPIGVIFSGLAAVTKPAATAASSLAVWQLSLTSEQSLEG
jgi:hypothetical protein